MGGVLLLACASASADDEALRRIEALRFEVDKRVAYVERQSNRLLRRTSEARGWVWLESDGSMVMLALEPRLEERRLTKARLVLRRPEPYATPTDPGALIAQTRPRHMVLDPQRVGHAVLIAMADVLSGDAATLAASFRVVSFAQDEAATDDRWEVQLAPSVAPLLGKVTAMHLRGFGNRLAGLRVERGQRRWRSLEFVPSESR